MQIKTETKVGFFVIIALVMMSYMAFFLGGFKWHLHKQNSYIVLFKNAAGLNEKADVKIAGVKVGWIDKITLSDDGQYAQVTIMINDRYKLYTDAQAEVCQEGLLASKFISIQPGLIVNGLAITGSCLKNHGNTPASLDDLMTKFNQVAQNIDQLVNKLLPVAQGLDGTIKRFDHILKQDFDKIILDLDQTLTSVQSIVKKFDHGKGSLGRLLNETELYDDMKLATNKIKQFSQSYDGLSLVVDSHFESMFRSCENYCHKQAKGYLDVWANFNCNYFGLFELVWSECGGVVDRNEFFTSYYNQNNQPLSPTQLANLGCSYAVVPPLVKETKLKRDLFMYGIQAGRWFNNIAFRAGLIENYFGFALDYDIPFENDHWNWVTTLEFFDFKGQSRLCDHRPHFKWLNEVYYKDNFYLAFGVDDFVSKNNLNPFVGIGLSFGNC